MRNMHIEEHSFESWDGTQIFYRAWHPGEPQKKAVILFHGGHEHSERFTPVIEALDLPGVSFFGWDARGHGRSPGPRGYARSFQDLVKDAHAFAQAVSTQHGIKPEDTAVMGHSEGSVIASALVLDHMPGVRGMVLGSPAIQIKLYFPFAYPLMKLWARVRPNGFVNSFVVSSMLTHDPEERAQRNQDPLIARPIGLKALLGLLDEGKRLVERAPRIRVPALVLSAGSDWVVHLKTQKTFVSRLGSAEKEHIVYPGFYHEVFHEKDRHLPIGRTREFLAGLFEEEPAHTPGPAGAALA